MLALAFQILAILFVTIGVLVEFARKERAVANLMFGLALTCFCVQLATFLPDTNGIEEYISTAVASLAFGVIGLLVVNRAFWRLLSLADPRYPKKIVDSVKENERLWEKEV